MKWERGHKSANVDDLRGDGGGRGQGGLFRSASSAFCFCSVTAQRPFAPGAFFCAPIFTTTTSSACRSAACIFPARETSERFTSGLFACACGDDRCADGSLVFRVSPCTRAASNTPPRSNARSDASAFDVAFAVT